MEQSKFISALKKLTPARQQAYAGFVQSPYFNKQKDVTRFVLCIIDPEIPNTDAQQVFSKMYPGKVYDKRRIPDLMYKALKLLEQFLAQEEFDNQTWQQKINLLKAVHTHDITELAGNVQNEIDELQKSKALKDCEYYYEEYQYNGEAFKIFLNQARIKEDENLQLKVDNLDLFYLSARLRDSCEMLNRTRILSADYNLGILDELMQIVSSNLETYTSYPAVYLYYKIALMLQDPENTLHFKDLKDSTPQNIGFFGRDEQRSLYGYLQNYCIRKVNSGKPEFYRELFDIYKYMMDTGLMGADNKNLQWDLKNMVSIALRLGEHDWTLDTINRIKPNLHEDIAANAYAYNYANYCYETRNYKKATRLLQSVEFKEVYYNLDSKAMLLKIYYEQEEEETFYAHVHAFKTYLNRNKLIADATAVIYGNMVKYARKAFSYKTLLPYQRQKNQKKIQAFREEIINNRQIANLTWLLREVEDLIR